MNHAASCCGISEGAQPNVEGSRILRFQPESFRWEGVPSSDYKPAADHWDHVTRMLLLGGRGERTAFHVRYIEIGPAGFTTLERHAHEHAVVVLRGQGQVQLGQVLHEVRYGDMVYVAPYEVHQLRNPSTTEPFGFLCMVDAQRDTAVPIAAGKLTSAADAGLSGS